MQTTNSASQHTSYRRQTQSTPQQASNVPVVDSWVLQILRFCAWDPMESDRFCRPFRPSKSLAAIRHTPAMWHRRARDNQHKTSIQTNHHNWITTFELLSQRNTKRKTKTKEKKKKSQARKTTQTHIDNVWARKRHFSRGLRMIGRHCLHLKQHVFVAAHIVWSRLAHFQWFQR